MASIRLFARAATPALSIILILAGLFLLRGPSWAAGAACLVLAMLGFGLSMRWLDHDPLTPAELDQLRAVGAPVGFWSLVSALLVFAVVNASYPSGSKLADRLASAAWVGSVGLGLLFAIRPGLPARPFRALRERLATNKTEWMLLLLVLISALVLRTAWLSAHPYPWSGDEASIGSEAQRILRGEVTNLFDTGWSSQPNWSFVPAAVTQQLLGRHVAAIRWVSVVTGFLAVLFTYLAGRELFNPFIGLLAPAFLASLPYHLHFSRIGVNNVADSFLSALTFWLLAAAVRRDDWRWFYAAGAAAGLSLYPYAGTRLVLILSAVLLAFLVLRRRDYLTTHWRHMVAFGGADLIRAPPQAAYFARHPEIFLGRFAQEGIMFNGWLGREAAATGQSVPAILLDQFARTTLVFVASPAPGNFFDSPYPYLTLIGSVLFLLGMGYALVRPLALPHFILLLWFWAVVFFGGVLTLNPPANTRLLMTTPAVALFMGLGTQKMVDYLRRHGPALARAGVALVVAVTLAITYQHVSFYLFEYRLRSYLVDPNGEFAMQVGLMAQAAGPDLTIYVLGAPRVFSGFPTIGYLAPDNAREDLDAEDVDRLALAPGQPAGFFATPDNRALLQAVQQRYPGGNAGVVERPARPGETLLEYYLVRP